MVDLAELTLRSARRAGRWGLPSPIELLVLIALTLLLVAPASADDLIAQWLQQDEASGRAQEVRPDLNAITDEQWGEMFAIGRERPDAFANPPVKHGSKSQTEIFAVWLAILTAGLALLVGGINGRAGIRRQWRTLTALVHMNDPSQDVIATPK